MLTRSTPLFKLFGFQIKADTSWIFLAVLVVWSLATGLFPQYVEGGSDALYWTLAVIGAAGLFASIILHELGHALVARHYGIPISGISLFIFGGVAEMDSEPADAKSELLMALAGPGVSLALALLLTGAHEAAWFLHAGAPLLAVLAYLAWLNLILAVFNMIPAFPLDGGRVLRAALWAWRNNLRSATRISSAIGAGFGLGLITLGVFTFMSGNVIMGVWWFMIGLFMRSASQMSYKQLLVRRALEGEPIRRFMRDDVVTVGPGDTIEDFVHGVVYKHHYKAYPVVAGERLVGLVSTRDIKEVPREEWSFRTLDEVVQPSTPQNTVQPGDDAMWVLSLMSRGQISRLMVVDQGRLAGMVTLKDLLGFLTVKLDLEEPRP